MAKFTVTPGGDGADMELHPVRSDHTKMKRPADNFDFASSDASNGVKMTPMIDVIFQLLIFLMCALHFRSLETKLESFLPANKEITKPLTGGATAESQPNRDVRQVVIALIHNDQNLITPMIKLDGRTIAGYEELTRQLNDIRRTNNEISVTVEPQGQIPAQCVVDAIDACQKAGVTPKLAK